MPVPGVKRRRKISPYVIKVKIPPTTLQQCHIFTINLRHRRPRGSGKPVTFDLPVSILRINSPAVLRITMPKCKNLNEAEKQMKALLHQLGERGILGGYKNLSDSKKKERLDQLGTWFLDHLIHHNRKLRMKIAGLPRMTRTPVIRKL